MTIRCPHCSGQLKIVAVDAPAPAPPVVLDLAEYGSPSGIVARLRKANFHTIADQIEAQWKENHVVPE